MGGNHMTKINLEIIDYIREADFDENGALAAEALIFHFCNII